MRYSAKQFKKLTQLKNLEGIQFHGRKKINVYRDL